MLAKILVGVVAAIAVTGVGVYYATQDDCHTCQGTKATQPEGTTPTSEGPSCCATKCPADEPTTAVAACCSKELTVEKPASCCAAKAGSVATDNLGACVGGMAVTTTTKAVRTCCDD